MKRGALPRAGARRSALLLASVVTLACQSEARDDGGVRARFGVLFGGQIQERQTLPLIIDQTRQTQLLRVEFTPPRQQPTEVTWEIDRPALGKGSAAGARVVETGRVELPAGRATFDQNIPFRPGDPLGRWFIRARVGGRGVLDRGFDVVEATSEPAANTAR